MLLPSIAVLLLLVSCVGAIWFLTTRGNTKTPVTSKTNKTTRSNINTNPPKVAAPMVNLTNQSDVPTPVDTEFKLLEFAFEPKLLAGHVPDARTKVVPKPAGYPPFKLVPCASTGYAIRWSGRYLTMRTSSEFYWSTTKMEPNSCFQVVPGYCDSTEYIMIRSLFNRYFLRVDGATKKLVAVDAPTRNNADNFCWKMANDEPKKMPCGPQFIPEYGQVVNIPCEIKLGPPCGDATPGFKSACCMRYPDDATCRGAVFREVMGRPVAEAALYIKSRLPGVVIKKCERSDQVCNRLKPFPIYDENTMVLPYDKRLGIVSGPAFRWI